MIDELKVKIDSIFKDFEVVLRDAEKNGEMSTQLAEFDRQLKVKDDDLRVREKKVSTDKGDILEEKRYISRKVGELEANFVTMRAEWEKLAARKTEYEDLEKKKEELVLLQLEVDKKLAKSVKIDEQLADIKKLLQIIDREKEDSRKRKKELELEAEINAKERTRLQGLAVKLGSSL